MNRGQRLAIVVVIVIMLLGVGLFSLGGFTGTTSSWNRIEKTDMALPINVVPIITGTATGWTISYGYDVLHPTAPYDIKFEIAGQPQKVKQEDKPDIIVDNGDGTNTLYKWSVWTLELGVDVMSIGGNVLVDRTSYNGLQVVMRLQNNYRSVWLDAKDSFGYVTEVWVKEYDVKLEGNQHSIMPSAQGAFFELFSVDGGGIDPPDAYSTVLDIEELKSYATVDIKFTVDEFGPLRWMGVYEDAHVYYTLNMRVVVLGIWQNVVPTHTQGPAPDPRHFDPWEFLLSLIVTIVTTIVGAIIIIVVPDKRVKIAIGIIIFVIALWDLGFLEGWV